MAHELAHVKNRDTLIMTRTATIAGAIAFLANFGLFFRGGGDNRANLLAMIAAVIIAPFAAMIVQMAISRTREYSADRGAAEIGRNPRALASALAKLHEGAARIPNPGRSEEHTSELQSLIRNSSAVFCLKHKKKKHQRDTTNTKENKMHAYTEQPCNKRQHK